MFSYFIIHTYQYNIYSKPLNNDLFIDLPIPEVFAFAFNTLLCDMIMLSQDYRDQILEAQQNLLKKCVEALENNDHEGNIEISGNNCLDLEQV